MNPVPASLAHDRPQLRIAGQFFHRHRKLRNVMCGNHTAVPVVFQQIWNTPRRIAGNDGQAASRCFVHDQSPRISVGGKHKCLRQGIVARQLLTLSKGGNSHEPAFDGGGPPGYLSPRRPISHENQGDLVSEYRGQHRVGVE